MADKILESAERYPEPEDMIPMNIPTHFMRPVSDSESHGAGHFIKPDGGSETIPDGGIDISKRASNNSRGDPSLLRKSPLDPRLWISGSNEPHTSTSTATRVSVPQAEDLGTYPRPIVGSAPLMAIHKPNEPLIRRKKVGSVSSRRRRLGSSGTVVHSPIGHSSLQVEAHPSKISATFNSIQTTPQPNIATLGEAKHMLLQPTLVQELEVPPVSDPFLDILPKPSEPGGHSDSQEGNKATAILSQSVMTKQVLTLHHSSQNQEDMHLVRNTSKLLLPQIYLRDPVSARIPEGLKSPVAMSKLVREEAPLQARKQGLRINMSTIITTGCDPLQHPLPQYDGQVDDTAPTREVSVNPQRPRPITGNKQSRIPTPTASFQGKVTRNFVRSASSPTKVAGIAISSANHQTMMKEEIPNWYHKVFQGGKESLGRSILTSTSMSPEVTGLPPSSPVEQKGEQRMVATSAARTAFLHASPAKRRSMSLTPKLFPLNLQTGMRKATSGLNGQGQDQGDIDDLSRSQSEVVRSPNLLRLRVEMAREAGGPRMNAEDGFVTWASGVADKRRTLVQGRGEKVGPPNQIVGKRHGGAGRGPTGNVSMLMTMCNTTKLVVQTAWWFVEPVFTPTSPLRGRWEQQQLTWRDALLVVASCGFAIGALLVAVLVVRMLVFGVKIFRGIGTAITLLLGG